MAKKMDNETLAVIAGVGIVAYIVWSDVQNWQKPTYNPTANYANEIGVAPVKGSAGWQAWIGTAITFYGSIDHLFAPGGAFYNNNVTQQDLDQYYDEVANNPNGDIFTTGNGTLSRIII